MEFIVMKCCQCSMFQVHQQRKTKKWGCKMCGMKQSIIKVYFLGTSSDCRKVVQQNNMKQSDEEALREVVNNLQCTFKEEFKRKDGGTYNTNASSPHSTQQNVSKWAKYEPEPQNETDSSDDAGCPQLQPSWSVKPIKGNSRKRFHLAERQQQRLHNDNSCKETEASSYSKRCKAAALVSKEPSKENASTSKWGQFRSTEED